MEGILRSKWFWFLGILFVLSPLIVVFGIVWIPKLPFFKPPPPVPSPPPQEETIPVSKLPIAADILQNPMVYEWRGSVEGKVVEIDVNTITLSDDENNRLVIPVIPSTDVIYGTKFYKRETKDNIDQFVNVSHRDLPLGVRLRGDFFVAAREKDKIIGSSFEIIE